MLVCQMKLKVKKRKKFGIPLKSVDANEEEKTAYRLRKK